MDNINWANMKENSNCYVCDKTVVVEEDLYALKHFEANSAPQLRHLWHGVPGITRAVGGGGGFNGYAPTLELAKQRAEYYVNNNPYAAPEVRAGEQEILDEVNRLLQKQRPVWVDTDYFDQGEFDNVVYIKKPKYCKKCYTQLEWCRGLTYPITLASHLGGSITISGYYYCNTCKVSRDSGTFNIPTGAFNNG